GPANDLRNRESLRNNRGLLRRFGLMRATAINLFNLALLIVALIAASAFAFSVAESSSPAQIRSTAQASSSANRAPAPDYQRIASASVVADEILLQLCDPQRIVAFTEYSKTDAPSPQRFAGKPGIRNLEDIEAIAALRPDLLIVHEVSDRRQIDR